MNNNSVNSAEKSAFSSNKKQVSRFAKQAGRLVGAAAQFGAGVLIKGTAPMEVKSINPQASSAGKAMFNKNAAYFNSIHGDSSDTKVTHLEGNKGQALLEKGVADLGDALVSSSKKNFKKAFSSEEETQNLKEQAAAGFEALKNKTQKQNDINKVAETLSSGGPDFYNLAKHENQRELLRNALYKTENKKELNNEEHFIKEVFDYFKEERPDYGDAKAKTAFFNALSEAILNTLYDKLVSENQPDDNKTYNKEKVLEYTRMSEDVFKDLKRPIEKELNIALAQEMRKKLKPFQQDP